MGDDGDNVKELPSSAYRLTLHKRIVLAKPFLRSFHSLFFFNLILVFFYIHKSNLFYIRGKRKIVM